jgi:hypothetical protein
MLPCKNAHEDNARVQILAESEIISHLHLADERLKDEALNAHFHSSLDRVRGTGG